MAHLRREELPILASAGMSVGNHTYSHPCLSRCTDEEVRLEILEAHRILTETIGAAPLSFAYPDGDWDPRGASILEEFGYQAAFQFDHRLSESSPRDPLCISRLRVDSTASLNRFRIILSGLHPALHRLRGGK
jgi:peptidoglycan/xylan/chitin deacetylase (PgdA/CDA1 family)